MEGIDLRELPDGTAAPSRSFWLAALLITVPTALLYFAVIRDLVLDWWNNPDYTYAFLVPPFVSYVIWQKLRRFRTPAIIPNNCGLPVILCAMALLFLGTLGADYFTSRLSLCLLLAGLVLYLLGWPMLRLLAFPLSYLMLMVPLPGIIHNQVTFPLQLISSKVAAFLIELTGVPVFREGNILKVPHYTVEVVQACSGIRSLLALIAMGIAYGYFAERRVWARAVLVVLMLPIALFTNSLRIMTTSLLGYAVDPSWAEGFTHLFSGWLIFLLALGLLFSAHSLMGGRGEGSTVREQADA